MGDPILLLLAVDVVALLLLGTFAAAVPSASAGLVAAGLCGFGTLLSLWPLLLRHLNLTAFTLPIGPPGLSLHFALDPLAACFLMIAFIAGTAIAAVQATAAPMAPLALVRVTAFCLAGTALSLLAADGVTLAIGLTAALGAIWINRSNRHAALLIPLLLLAAVCVLTPSGFAPRFDTIRAAPVDPDRATAATAFIIAAVTLLAGFRPRQRCGIRDALLAGVITPTASYLLLRLVADLSGSGIQSFWGFALLLSGSATAIFQAWRSAAEPDIDMAVLCLSQRQGGLAMIGIGLALIARTADLPDAASFALAATTLSAIGSGVAGTLLSLAAHAVARSAETHDLSRLGGLMHQQPAKAVAFAVGLLGMSGILPGFSFACLWLLLQSIVSAPRGSGLAWQLPLALTAGASALSTAFATASAVRLAGIALLGSPRTSGGSGATDPTASIVLLILAGLSLLAGVLPGTTIWILASPAIQALTSTSPSGRTGVAFLSFAISAPGYLALPVLALLVLATGSVLLTRRGSRKDAKTAGVWTDGMTPLANLSFDQPEARSLGAALLPPPPAWRPPALPQSAARWIAFGPSAARWTAMRHSAARWTAMRHSAARWTAMRHSAARWTAMRPSAVAALWLLLAAWAVLLLVLSVV